MRANLRDRAARTYGGLLLACALWPILATADAMASHTKIVVRDQEKTATAEAVVELHGTPQAVYGALSDYQRWPRLFRDVVELEVIESRHGAAILRVKSRALGHSHTFRVTAISGQRVRMEIVESHLGASFWQEFAVAPGRAPHTTRLEIRLHADVKGVWGWFARASTLSKRRIEKLTSDAEDLARKF